MTRRDGVTIVTGGASGLGAAIVEDQAALGRPVVIFDVDLSDAPSGDGISAVEVDVTDWAGVADAVEKAAAVGPLSNLVLSAAVETRAPLEETADEDWRHVIDVNLKGPFVCMRHTVPHLVANGGGSIVALGSTLGMTVAPQYSAYCASKFGLTNLCKQVAIEHAPDDVRVNVLAPSATDTGLFMRLTSLAPNPEEIRAGVAANMPMQRLGTAADVCAAVRFLTDEGSSYLSGAVIPLDGGLAARRL
jgi:NAD(P)-dependent dehydrogenase (short-subunit alcohol dehydrogenase family)